VHRYPHPVPPDKAAKPAEPVMELPGPVVRADRV